MLLLRSLTYFVSFAVNFLVGGCLFIVSHRLAVAGCSGKVVGGSTTAWAVAVCLLTPLVGRIVTVNNALRLILAGGGMLVISAAGFLIFDGLYTQFLWVVLVGVGAALFCSPFQIFARSVENSNDKNSGAAMASGLYTLTWSLGFTFGQLIFARFAISTGFAVSLVLAVSITVAALLIAGLNKKSGAGRSGETETAGSAPDPLLFTGKTYSRLAVMGWIIGALGVVTICQVRGMWPIIGSELDIPRKHVAGVIALVSGIQGLTAWSLCRSKIWMYKRFPALLMAFAGIAGLLLFACGKNLYWFYPAAVIYGIFSGCFYFLLVYHSLVHPEKSAFFVSGNEVLVGIVSMVMPFFGGFLADWSGSCRTPFIFAAAVCAVIFAAQMITLKPSKLERL